MITTLEQAVKELTDYNNEHPFLVAKMQPPGDEYVRMVAHHDGQIYKVCLTRMFMAKTWLWMLSIMKPYGQENEDGARLPSEAEAAVIAEAFFPKGFTALNDGDQIIAKTCLKFITTETQSGGDQ